MRGIGVWALSASVINSVIGVGIFTLPAAVALETGAFAPAAYLICAVIMAGVTICFASAGSRVPTSGGAYGTVEAAFGPAAGFVVGILLVVSDLLASGGIAAAIADVAGGVTPAFGAGWGRLLVIVALYAVLCWANLVGVQTTARLITGVTLLKLAPLVLFLFLGALSFSTATPVGPAAPSVTVANFSRGLILAMFAFEGMETALGASGEVREPNRSLPLALFLSMLFVLVLYVCVQCCAQHMLGASLAHEASPLAQAAGQIIPITRKVMLAGASLSMLAWLASDVLGTSRMLFAMARDRRLPAWLGALEPRTHVPARAVLAYTTAAAILAMTGSFLELVVLSSLAAVAVYILTCLAAVVLQHRNVARAGPPLRLPGVRLAAGIGLLGMVVMVICARWQEQAGLAALVATSLIAFLLIPKKS